MTDIKNIIQIGKRMEMMGVQSQPIIKLFLNNAGCCQLNLNSCKMKLSNFHFHNSSEIKINGIIFKFNLIIVLQIINNC